MPVTLTERAAEHVSRSLAKRGKGVGLRVGLRNAGCSGMSYQLEYADAIDEGDVTFESHGIQIVVDRKNLPYLEGTVVDFGREGLNSAFKFSNPNVKDQCGCGESFSV